MGQALLAVHDYGNATHQNITETSCSWHRVEVETECKIIDFKRDGLSIFGRYGLSTTLYRCDISPPTPVVKDIFTIKNDIRTRLLIVSATYRSPTDGRKERLEIEVIENNTTSKKHTRKPKRTRGRKKVVYSTHFNNNGEWLEVNADENMGYYPEMMSRFVGQFDAALSIHKRLFVVRFDLHQKDHYTNDSKMLTDFFERFKRRLESHYNGLHSIGYVWAREHEKAKAQHYHCALFLDFDIVCKSKVTGDKARESWEKLRPGNTVHLVSETYRVDSPLSRAMAIKRISYLAKERGKGHRPSQSKDSNASRLKLRI